MSFLPGLWFISIDLPMHAYSAHVVHPTRIYEAACRDGGEKYPYYIAGGWEGVPAGNVGLGGFVELDP